MATHAKRLYQLFHNSYNKEMNHTARNSCFHFALLVAIIILGAWLRFHGLGSDSFWGDEFCYVYLDKHPPAQHHAHTHGFDMLIHGYAKVLHLLGTSLHSEAAFRALSASLGVAAIAVIFAAGTIVEGAAVGLIAAFLAAIWPFSVIYGRDATQYGCALFGSVSVVCCGLAAVKHNKWWMWLLLALSSAFLFHVQIMFTALVVAVWLAMAIFAAYGMCTGRKNYSRFIWSYVLSALLTALLCLPEFWFYVLPTLRGGAYGNIRASTHSLLRFVNWGAVAQLAGRRESQLMCVAFCLCAVLFRPRRSGTLLLITTLTLLTTLVVLHKIKMQLTFDMPPRYVSFLLPLMWLLSAVGVWWVARLVGMCIAGVIHVPSIAKALQGAHSADYAVRVGTLFTMIRTSPQSKIVSALTAALVLIVFFIYSYQAVLHRKHIFGFSDWREAAAFLKTHARSNDVIVTSYHDDILRFYGTNFPCALVRAYGAYDGRDFTLERLHELQAQYPRIWSILVNKYMRWNSHPAAVEMDREWIAMPTDDPIIHYWDRTEASSWRDISIKRAKEKELLSAYLRQAPRHYLVRRHLGLLQYWTGDYTASLSNWFMVLRQYPFDPWNWEVPGLCYRDGKGVVQELPRALRFFRVMYWVARFEHHPDRRARLYALRYLADTYRLMKRPKRVLAVVKEWERQLPLSKLTRDQIEHERRTLGALRTDALDRLGLLPVFSNLLHNSDFARPVRIWDGSPSNAIGNWSLLAPWFTNHVNYGRDSDGRYFARVYNDVSNRYTGVMQSVVLQSGSVYRLSGKGRSTSDIMGMRLVAEVRPEGSQRPAESHQVVWWQGSREWQRLGTVFTNHLNSPAMVVVQMGYGNVISTGEITGIRMEVVEK